MTPEPVTRFEWERLIRRAQVPAGVKLLAFVLATYADPDGTRVRPGVALLASDTGQASATVKRGLAQLRDVYGLLEQVSRGGGRNGKGKAAEYRLVFPADLLERVELAPLPRDSEITQMSPQTPPSPVDNSDSGLTQESPENSFQGSNSSTSDGLRDQIGALRDHPGDPLPNTSPTTKDDHDSGYLPTQLPDARASPKCEHGLPNHRRNGKPTCFACRRGLPSGKESA